MAVVHPSYLGFFADVKIHDTEEGARKVYRFRHPEFPFISGVTIVVQGEESQLSTITLGIDAPFTIGQKMLNSRMFAVGNGVEVLLGYPEGPISKPFYGYFHDGGVGLELTPEGLTGNVTANTINRAAFYAEVHSGSEPLKAYKKAAEACGYEVTFSPLAEDALVKVKARIIVGQMGNQNLLTMLNRLANLKDLREFTDGKSKMSVRTQAETFSAPAVRRFVMRGQFDEATNSYPIHSYGPELQPGQFAFTSPAARGLKTASIDKEGKVATAEQMVSQSSVQPGKEETQGGDPKDASTQAPGEGGGRELESDRKARKKEFIAFIGFGYGDQPKSLIIAQQRHLQDQAGHGAAWNAVINTVGIPDIQPFETCRVEGIGSLFDGTYLIMTVTHKATVGNYQTTLAVNVRTLDSATEANTREASGTS